MPYLYHCPDHGERKHKHLHTDGRRYCCDVCRRPVRLEFIRHELPRVEVETPLQTASNRAARAESESAHLRSILADFTRAFEAEKEGFSLDGRGLAHAYHRAIHALRTGGNEQ